MAQKFLTNVELEAGLVDGSNSTGTSGYLLSSTGTATSWVDPAAVSVGESEQVHIACKNTSGVAISKGDPVYITGTVGASFIIQIAKADASDSAKMPAVGLAETDLGLNDEGFVIVSGVLKNLTTDPLSTSDGTPSSNDTVYVKVGGGLTRTKPTGSGNLIQNVGKVGRISSANAGSLAVSTIMRTNDVPNLTTGKIWVGSPTYTTESTVVHLDETNGRMGIGTTSPGYALSVDGDVQSDFFRSYQYPTSSFLDFDDDTTPGSNGTALVSVSSMKFIADSNNNGTTDAFSWIVDGLPGAGSTLMTLTDEGNVGIGTTSPAQKLHVDGNIRVGDSADTVFSNRFYALSNAHVYLLANSGYDLKFYAGGTEKMVVSSAGSVGIGTTSPLTKLNLADSSSGAILSFKRSNSTTSGAKGGLTWVDSSNYYVAGISVLGDGTTDNSGELVFRTSTGEADNTDLGYQLPERMRIDSAGNVGIGTSSPNEILHIESSSPKIQLTNTSTNASSYIDADSAFGSISIMADHGNTSASSQINLMVDGSSKMVVKDTGNVGIGTTSPQEELHIASTVPVIRLEDTDGGYAQVVGSNGSLSLRSDQANTVASSIIDFTVDNSEKMRIDSSGNVGVGTTSPGATLEVAKGSEGDYLIVGGDNAGNNRALVFTSSTATSNGALHTIRAQSSNGQIAFSTNTSEALRIDSSQNVGIGTTSPNYRLVTYKNNTNYNAFFTGGNGTKGVGIGYDNTTPVIQGLAYNSDTTYYDLSLQPSGGNVGIGTTSPGTKLDVVTPNNTVGIQLQNKDGNSTVRLRNAGSPSRGEIYLDDNGSNTVLFAALGNSYINSGGNFGIGTNSPSNRLEIVGPYSSTPLKVLRHGDYGNAINLGRNGVSETANIGYPADATLNFSTSGSERMRIDSSGNVGIGTTSPSAPLDVVGNIKTTTNFIGDNAIVNKITAATASGSIKFRNNSGSDRVTILDGGNVGIGTTSPGEKLDVAGRTRVDQNGEAFYLVGTDHVYSAWYPRGTSNGRKAYIGYASASTTDFTVMNEDNGAFVIGTNNAERMRIISTGNVGIGTTSPNAKLDVSGNIKTTAGGAWATSSGGVQLTYDGTVGYLTTYYDSNSLVLGAGVSQKTGIYINGQSAATNDIKFKVGNSTRVTFDSSGNVGIGTTSPGSLLQLGDYPSNNIDITTYPDVPSEHMIHITAPETTGNYGGGISFGENTFTGANITVQDAGSNGSLHMLFGTRHTSGIVEERMRIDSSGNVGIGTESPQSKLHIETGSGGTYNPNTNHDDVTIEGSGNIGLQLFSPNSSYQYIAFGDPDSVNAGYLRYYHGANEMVFRTSNSDKMVINSSGNVGIGTTSPEELLHIKNGDVGVTPYDLGTGLNIEGTTSNVGINIISSNTGQGRIYFASPSSNTAGAIEYNHDATLSNGFMKFRTGNSERMRIDGSGNVGIGTTSPSHKLTVNASNNTTALGIDFPSARFDFSANSTSGYASNFRMDDVGMDIGHDSIYRSLNLQTGNQDRLTISGDGNVGIATTAPQTGLQLYSTADDTTVGGAHKSAIRLTSSYGATFGGGGELQFGLHPSSVGRDVLSVIKGTYSAYSSENYGGDLEFHTRDADGLGLKQRMTIAHDGNVGINTTSPGATLEVVGRSSDTEAAFKVTDSGDRFFEVVPDNSTTFRLGDIDGLGDEPVIIGGYSYLKFNVSGSTTMTLDTNNRVGIGTTNPRSKLHVEGTTGSVPALGAAASAAQIGGSTYGTLFSTLTSGTGVIQQGRSDGVALTFPLLINPNGGNVGIGTTSPDGKLHIDGISDSVSGLVLEASNNGDNRSIDFQNTAGALRLGLEYDNVNINLDIVDRSRNKLVTFREGGNVGIGTSAPAYQLQLSLNSAAKPSSSLWTVVSDSRVKENIRDYTTGLEAILKIEPKLYDYNGKAGFEKTKDNIGIIAQDMQDIMPETIKTYNTKLNEDDTEDTELLNFDGHAVTFALINAVKDLKAEIEELKNRIQTLENK